MIDNSQRNMGNLGTAMLVLAAGALLAGCAKDRQVVQDPAALVRAEPPRAIATFFKLRLGMSPEEVALIVPFAPEAEVGSGLVIYLYQLDDGSEVFVGYSAGGVIYVRHNGVNIER